jgi:uncharacterized protein YacL (UPF0231 family)
MPNAQDMRHPPLTPEQRQIARGLVTEWFDAEVSKAEKVLAEAEAKVAAAHKARADWHAREPLTEMQVIMITADASQAFINEAQLVFAGKGDRDKANELRDMRGLVAQYLSDKVGRDISGGRA